MHRVRTSLSYFAAQGWEAQVVTVDVAYTDMVQDELLLQSIPVEIKVHKVKALNKRWTGKLGLGSLALRSLWYYKKYLDQLLKAEHFDLIYFSTTQFPVCVLGAHWKKKFNVPYVIDMQDPWHSEYYQDKPKNQRPAKYWFSYRLNKYLEPLALKNVSGLISVSADYITGLKQRYPQIKDVPSAVITFGLFDKDAEIALANQNKFPKLLSPGFINIVYAGRGGADMHKAITPLFSALAEGLKNNQEVFNRFRFHFIGTSYAASGQGKPTILPLAQQFAVEGLVTEITDRISYYHTLTTLQQADALFIAGSDDAKYTASKIYPYLMMKKPLLAIFNPASSAIGILKDFGINTAYSYTDIKSQQVNGFLTELANGTLSVPQLSAAAINEHSAETKTLKQCRLFDEALAYHLK